MRVQEGNYGEVLIERGAMGKCLKVKGEWEKSSICWKFELAGFILCVDQKYEIQI